KIPKDLAPALLGEVERDRTLSAVEGIEEAAAVPPIVARNAVREDGERAGIRIVDSAGIRPVVRFDFDDLGAQVGQQRRSLRGGYELRAAENANSGKQIGHA